MQIFWLNRDAAQTDTVILYLHGGAYVNPPQKVQWDACDSIAAQAGCAAVLPVYLTAPNFTFDQCYDALLELYDSMLETYAPSDIVLMGDSAGGGLALGLAMWLDELGYEQPKMIVCYSPELDITLSNPDLKEYEKLDAMLAIDGIVEMGASGPAARTRRTTASARSTGMLRTSRRFCCSRARGGFCIPTKSSSSSRQRSRAQTSPITKDEPRPLLADLPDAGGQSRAQTRRGSDREEIKTTNKEESSGGISPAAFLRDCGFSRRARTRRTGAQRRRCRRPAWSARKHTSLAARLTSGR
jgi:acetyl esterase/lipase